MRFDALMGIDIKTCTNWTATLWWISQGYLITRAAYDRGRTTYTLRRKP